MRHLATRYTDNVDVARNNFGYGQGRGYGGQDAMVHEMREFAQLVVGLYVAPLHWRRFAVAACAAVALRD